jgi:hypothetical protein
MEIPRIPRTGLGLRDVFSQAYRAQPQKAEGRRELTPVESMLLRSQGVDLVRQYLPSWGGGYSASRMKGFEARRSDPDFREQTMRVGDYPGAKFSREGVAADGARRVAQAAGALTADATTQGAQNIWWFINAFQAASSAAAQQAMHGALGPNRLLRRPGIPGAPTGAPFRHSNYAVAATFPVVLGASAAVGNLFRQPGYAAILPSEEDRRESDSPLVEVPLRAIGMTGRLLPFDDFSQERPDVSRGEYEAYKAYLFGSPMPVKLNADGIHGAEINLLGRSIPLLTGVLPVAGGVLGGAVGLRMAGKRLAASGQRNKFQTASGMDTTIEKLKQRQNEVERAVERLDRRGQPESARAAQAWTKARGEAQERLERTTRTIDRSKGRRQQATNRVEDALLLGALGGSSAGLSVTAAGAQLLEQVRRAQNMEENRRREAELAAVETEQLPPA